MAATIPPLIVRVPGAEIGTSGTLMTVAPEGVCELQVKTTMDGAGLIVRAYNLTATEQTLALNFPDLAISAAYACTPVEDNLDELAVNNNAVSLAVPSRSVACARIILR